MFLRRLEGADLPTAAGFDRPDEALQPEGRRLEEKVPFIEIKVDFPVKEDNRGGWDKYWDANVKQAVENAFQSLKECKTKSQVIVFGYKARNDSNFLPQSKELAGDDAKDLNTAVNNFRTFSRHAANDCDVQDGKWTISMTLSGG